MTARTLVRDVKLYYYGNMPATYDYMHPSWYPAVQLHGALGNAIIYEQRKYGLRIRPYVYPYNPKTPKQMFWRDYMAKGVDIWQGLDQNSKDFYNKDAVPYRMSGMNRFLHMYLKAMSTNLIYYP